MTIRQLFIRGAVALLVCASGWAQQSAQPLDQNPASATRSSATAPNPTTENPNVSSNSADIQESTPKGKQKHWSGSLVDVSCMQKAIPAGSDTGAAPAPSSTTPQANPPQFAPSGVGYPAQTAQRPGSAAGPAGQNPSAPSTYPGQSNAQSPDMNQAQAAQMAKASRVDEAAKQCAASSSTRTFGLALSGGQVVKFDDQGNSKATEAMKQVVQPGKRVKAKVTGTLVDSSTVKVASVEVKGKRAAPAQSSSLTGQ